MVAAPDCSLANPQPGGNRMIKVSVLYASGEGVKFDLQYYCEKHMSMVRELLGNALKGIEVEHGISSMEPGSRPPYVAMGHLLFESMEAFQSAFGEHAQEIVADIPNYTNSQPAVQISEVMM
jgi:uncharacterized protein (TIGR02118 family)